MAQAVEARRPETPIHDPVPQSIRLTVNGDRYDLSVEPRTTLLDALRDELGLTGAKKGCDQGTCGTCTVLVDGKAIYACMTLALECEGREIETIEGMSTEDELHPIQLSFIEHDALQCGFCTPGQIMSVKGLLDADAHPTEADVERAVAGNLCRCGAYPKIVQAALDAARRLNA
ncbi:MAG: (2Fe-2S)-binding protein [Candidatus Bipolaricaulia bacterium]